jgi:hypothetical protein
MENNRGEYNMTINVGSLSQHILEAKLGADASQTVVSKFGMNSAVGTFVVPITTGGTYQTPTTAVAVRIKSGGNANDTAAGTGAREVTVYGLDENFALAEEAIATAGASASSYTTTTFSRIFRVKVTKSGTYASASAGSHSGDIVVEDSSSNVFATINSTGFPRGQSQIGSYAIPSGKTGYVFNINFHVGQSGAANVLFFTRESIGTTSAPYGVMRLNDEWPDVTGHVILPESTIYKCPAESDVGFMAQKTVSGTVAVSVSFDILLVDDNGS